MSSRSALELVGEQAAQRTERLSGIVVVEERGRLDELRLGVRTVGVQDAVLDVAFGRDDDEQHAPVGQAQEFQMPKRRLAPLRRHHDAGEMRELRQERRGGAYELLRAVGDELPFEPMDFDVLERLHHHQAVDEEPVAFGRRDAARGRMRTRDVAQVLEIGHHVADRRRRELEARLPGQHPRPDGLSLGDVTLDQRLQQMLGAAIQHDGYFTVGATPGRPAACRSSGGTERLVPSSASAISSHML